MSVAPVEDEDDDDMPSFEFESTRPDSNWQLLTYLLIRPLRVKYHEEQLDDLVRKPKYGLVHSQRQVEFGSESIALSLFEPTHAVPELTILYLHGNSSCRIEVVTLLSEFYSHFVANKDSQLKGKVGLASFDFLGCGNSEGKFITLGCRQSLQIKTVVQHLEKAGRKVALWGRSMGAASILKYGGADINVLDSPFSDIKVICKEFSLRAVPFLCCLIHCCFPLVFCCINRDIRNETGHDIASELTLLENAARFRPSQSVLLLAGTQDELVPKHHSTDIFLKLPCRKELFVFTGSHNSKRPKSVVLRGFEFIEEAFLQQMKSHK